MHVYTHACMYTRIYACIFLLVCIYQYVSLGGILALGSALSFLWVLNL